MESAIIKTGIESREDYDTLDSFDIRDDLSERGVILWDLVSEYYETDDKAEFVNEELLLSKIERKYPKHYDIFRGIVENAERISSASLIEEIYAAKKDALRIRLATAFSSPDNDDEIFELLNNYNNILEGKLDAEEDDTFSNVSPVELVEAVVGDNLIRVLPESLNTLIGGGAVRQHHICIFARPETGKSLFLLNMAKGFVQQGLKVLYMGNEDPTKIMLLRFICGLLGVTLQDIKADPQSAQEALAQTNYHLFTFKEMSPGTPHEIERAIRKVEPDVLICDQIYNLDMKEDGKVGQLGKAATFMRKMAKQYNLLAVSATQAGDSGDGKLYLEMGDIDWSNTGVQAQIDLLIGIGVNGKFERSNMRMLTLPKNKISNIHEPLTVAVQPEITKVLDQ